MAGGLIGVRLWISTVLILLYAVAVAHADAASFCRFCHHTPCGNIQQLHSGSTSLHQCHTRFPKTVTACATTAEANDWIVHVRHSRIGNSCLRLAATGLISIRSACAYACHLLRRSRLRGGGLPVFDCPEDESSGCVAV